jgi:K+-transporting ATPase ATPase A chain
MLQGWLQIALFLAALTAITPLIGGYMARVFSGEPFLLARVLGPLERLTYRAIGVDPARGQDWKAYARSVLVISALSWLALYLILRTQTLHPFNPEGFHSGTWDVTFNTTSSFVTNTDWQYYAGEATMTYFSRMAGLAVQNFLSAAVGICVAVALIRGIAARSGRSLGNFWRDLVRTLLYVLLPISVVGAPCWSRRASSRPSRAMRAPTRWRAACRRSPSAPSPRRRSSRNSARTAAASSTPTPRIRSRTQAASRTSSSCSRSCSSRPA